MHDLVDRIRRGWPVGMFAVMRGAFLGNLVQPLVKLTCRPRVQRGE